MWWTLWLTLETSWGCTPTAGYYINILSLPRGVVDTVADLGDQLGLYTHCVTVELGDGRIVNQGPCVQLPRYSKYCVNMREPFIHTLFN